LLLNIRKVRKVITFIILISVFIGSVFYFANLETYFERGSDRASMGSLETRVIGYAAAYEIISSSPLFGALPGGHEIAKSKLNIPGLTYNSAHNMFLQIAVEWGLPMGILFMLVLFLVIWNGIQVKKIIRDNQNIENQIWIKTAAYGTTAVAFAYLFEGLVVNIPPDFVFFLLGLSIANNRLANSKISSLEFQ
jgi:O-antigen ligase